MSEGSVIKLKDGSYVCISQYRQGDFEELISMYAALSDEALRWTRPPYNEATLRKLSIDENLILVAWDQQHIIGHCMLNVHQHPTGKGIASLIINLHQAFQNKGLGTAMVTHIIDWARKKGIHRIELAVVSEHTMALNVYETVGFKTEGIQKDAYYGSDGTYHDKVIMGLVLK